MINKSMEKQSGSALSQSVIPDKNLKQAERARIAVTKIPGILL